MKASFLQGGRGEGCSLHSMLAWSLPYFLGPDHLTSDLTTRPPRKPCRQDVTWRGRIGKDQSFLHIFIQAGPLAWEVSTLLGHQEVQKNAPEDWETPVSVWGRKLTLLHTCCIHCMICFGFQFEEQILGQ